MTYYVQHFGYWAVLAIVGLESIGIPLPGETTLISAALYAGATHNLQIVWVIAAAATGAIIGDNLGYLLGHWGGYRLLVRYGQYVGLDQRKVKVAHYLFARYGGSVVFFGRFTAILRTYAAFIAGTARMPWPSFLLRFFLSFRLIFRAAAMCSFVASWTATSRCFIASMPCGNS